MNKNRSIRRSHRLGAALTVAVMSGALVACGSSSGGETNSSGLPLVNFGATQNPSSIGTVAAVIKKEGLDEECGISMKAASFSPDAADVALLSGQSDVGYFGYNSWASSAEKTQKLALLAPLQAEHGSLFVPKDSTVKTLADLKGQKIALLPPVSGQYQDFKMLVAKMGMDLEKDFKPVTGPPPAIEAYLKRGEVAAAIMFEPAATKVELGGDYRVVFRLNDKWEELTGDPLYMLGISANRSWLEGHHKEARCAVQAIRKATELLASDPKSWDVLKDILGVTDQAELKKYGEDLGSIYTPVSPEKAAPAIRKQLEEAKRLNLIDEVPDPIFTPIGN